MSIAHDHLASVFPTQANMEATEREPLIWNEDDLPKRNYAALGARLAECGDLYRAPRHLSGLLLVNQDSRHEEIKKGAELYPVIVDRVAVRVVAGGKPRGGRLPAVHLNAMLRSEAFLGQFDTADLITGTPVYLPNMELATPGFNNGGVGQRVLYLGGEPPVSRNTDTISRFLDVMDFE